MTVCEHEDPIAVRGEQTLGHCERWRTQGREVRMVIVTSPVVGLLVAIVATVAFLAEMCGRANGPKASRTLTGCAGIVRSLAFRPDGKMLASVGAGGPLAILDLTAHFKDADPPLWTSRVHCAAFSPNNRVLATTNLDERATLHDLVTRESFPLHDESASTTDAACLAFSLDGTTLAVGQRDGQITLWDAATRRLQKTMAAHTDSVAAIACGPDGTTLASAAGDFSARVWDFPSLRQQFVVATQRTKHVAFAYSRDSRLLFLCDKINPVVRVWDLTTGNERAALSAPTGTSIVNLAASPDGTTLAIANYHGEVFFWDLVTGEIRPIKLKHPGVLALEFAPDGGTLATGGFDGTVHLWRFPIVSAE
jgi:WD40 repeat protein